MSYERLWVEIWRQQQRQQSLFFSFINEVLLHLSQLLNYKCCTYKNKCFVCSSTCRSHSVFLTLPNAMYISHISNSSTARSNGQFVGKDLDHLVMTEDCDHVTVNHVGKWRIIQEFKDTLPLRRSLGQELFTSGHLWRCRCSFPCVEISRQKLN